MKKYELIVDNHFRKIPTIASLGNRLYPNKDDIKYIRNVFALDNYDSTLEYIDVFRIKALIDMPDINVFKGDIGGFVQSERNLSQDGNCWIFDDAIVCGWAEVLDASQIRGNAIIIGGNRCEISDYALVKDNAVVIEAYIKDKCVIYDQAAVYGRAVSGNAEIFGNAFIYSADIKDNAKIYDNAELHGGGGLGVSGNAKVYGNAKLNQSAYSSLYVSDNAQVFGKSYIYSNEGRETDAAFGWSLERDGSIGIGGDCKIYDSIYGKGVVRGYLSVSGQAHISWRFGEYRDNKLSLYGAKRRFPSTKRGKAKKYLLSDDFILYDNRKLYKIIADIDIPEIDIKKGDFGGYIENESNLSQEGKCWLFEGVKVFENAEVFGDAQIYSKNGLYPEIKGNAKVLDNARIIGNVNVWDNSVIYENAYIEGMEDFRKVNISQNACVFGDASITGKVSLFGYSEIFGKAKVYDFNADSLLKSGDVSIYGEAQVYDDATITEFAEVFGKVRIVDQGVVCAGGKVYGNAVVAGIVQGEVYDDAEILDNSVVLGTVFGKAKLRDKAKVIDNAQVYGNAIISGNAKISGEAKVFDGAQVFDNAIVTRSAEIFNNARIGGRDFIDDGIYGGVYDL